MEVGKLRKRENQCSPGDERIFERNIKTNSYINETLGIDRGRGPNQRVKSPDKSGCWNLVKFFKVWLKKEFFSII